MINDVEAKVLGHIQQVGLANVADMTSLLGDITEAMNMLIRYEMVDSQTFDGRTYYKLTNLGLRQWDLWKTDHPENN